MKKLKLPTLTFPIVFACWSSLFAQDIAKELAKNQQDTVKSKAEIKSFFVKTKLIRNEYKLTDLELRLAINFGLDSDSLTIRSKKQLDNLAEVLLDPEMSELKIELAGHTCDIGDKQYNLELSKRRVQYAAKYLTQKHHINSARISTLAYGENQPLLPGAKTELERAVNRRVVAYLQENRAAIKEMLDKMPYMLGFSWAVFHYGKNNKTELINYDGTSVLNSNDEYRIFLRPARKKYVYIFQEDSHRKFSWLFPRKDSEFSNPLEPGEYFLPSKSKVFMLDENIGKESIYLVVTDEPALDLERIISKDITNAFADAISNTIKTRGLKKIKIGQPIGKGKGKSETIVISPPLKPLTVKNENGLRLGITDMNIANVMAQYNEFFMVVEFKHQ